MTIKAVVFDFGGVLIDWNPDYLYRQLIPDPAERRRFLTEVCGMDWVVRQDAGQSLEAGTAEKLAAFPEHEALIRAFYARWPEMIAGTFEPGVALVERLHEAGMPLYGLTNWSAETFPYAWERYAVLRRFRGPPPRSAGTASITPISSARWRACASSAWRPERPTFPVAGIT